jgi:hypothetical protein
MEIKTFKFGIRETPRGATAWMETPKGRKQEKRFINGYASAKIMAQRWINEQISVVQEYERENNKPASIIIETHKKDKNK